MNAERTGTRRPWLRRVMWIGAIVVALLLIVTSIAPGWLSTDSGRGWLFGLVSDAIPGGIEAIDVDLNWTGGQTVRELELSGADGRAVARVRQIDASYSLLQLARGSYSDGLVVIEGLELDLELDEAGTLNLAAAVAEPGPEEESKGMRKMLRELIVQLPESLDLTIELRDARISLTGPGFVAPVRWSGVNGKLSATGNGKPVRLDLDGTIGAASRATLQLELNGFDKTGRLRGSEAQLRLSLDAAWTEGEDAEDSIRMVRALLGPSTKLALEVVTVADAITLSSTTQSPLLELSGGAILSLGEGSEASLRVARPIKARYRITPEAVRFLSAGNAEVDLDEELALDAEVEEFGWTTGSRAVEANAQIALGDGRLNVRVGETVETIDWSGWTASITTGGSESGIRAALNGRLLDGNVVLQAAGDSVDDVRVRASVKQLPLAAIDRVAQGFTGRPGALVEWLGPKLNLTANYEPTESHLAEASLVVRTARLDVDLPLTVDRKEKTIRGAKASVRYALAPGLVPRVANESDLPLRLTAEQFRIPLGAFDAKQAAVDASLSIGRTVLAGPTPVTLDKFECRIASRSLAESVALDATGRIDSGTIEIHGKLDGLWDDDGRFGLDRARGVLDLVLARFPAGNIEPALGNRLDATVKVQARGTEALIDIDCRSDLISARLPLRTANRRVELREAGRVRYRVTPKTARRFASVELEQPFDLDLSLASLSAPVTGEPDLEQTRVSARLESDPIIVSDLLQGRSVTLSNADLSFDGANVMEGRLTAKGALAVRGLDLGGPLEFLLLASRTNADLNLKSGKLSAEVAGEKSNGAYRLTRPARAMLRVDPKLLEALEVRSDWLAGDLTLRLNGERVEIPAGLELERMKLNVDLSANRAALRSGGRDVTLDGAKLGVVADEGDLRVACSAGVGIGRFDLAGSARRWIEGTSVNRNAPIDARLTSNDLPTGLLSKSLSTLVGESLGLNARVEMPRGIEDRRGRVTFDATAPRLTANADLRLDDGVALAAPARLVWTLTPDALRELLPESKLRLREATQFTASVKTFRRSRKGEMVIDAQALVPLAALVDAKGKTTSIRNLNLGLSLPATDAPLKVVLDGAMEGGTKPGRLAGTLTIRDVAETRSLDELSVRGTVAFSNVAVAPIDGLLALDGYLPAVLGDEASAALTLQLVRGLGPVDLRLTSTLR